MLLWPLITPGVLPKSYIMTPLPPYPGGGNRAAFNPVPTRSAGRALPLVHANHVSFPFRPNHSQQPSADSQPRLSTPTSTLAPDMVPVPVELPRPDRARSQ